MKDKMTKEQISDRKKDFIHNQYQDGGSRMFINGESGDRQLIVDTYLDKDFSDYLEMCVRKYFNFK